MILEVRKLGKSFGARAVLQDISFVAAPGDVIAVIGPSGIGKTTLLRLLAGLEKPDAGEIVCAVARPGPQLGLMPQQAELVPWRRLLDNALLPCELAGTICGEQAARDNLARLGLAGRERDFPSALSGGMQQRAYLAGLLTLQPKLYLLDEPLGQLDIPNRRRAASILRDDVKTRSAAAVIVTHSIEEALFVADKIFVLGHGTITHRFAVNAKEEGFTTLDPERGYAVLLETIGGEA